MNSNNEEDNPYPRLKKYNDRELNNLRSQIYQHDQLKGYRTVQVRAETIEKLRRIGGFEDTIDDKLTVLLNEHKELREIKGNRMTGFDFEV